MCKRLHEVSEKIWRWSDFSGILMTLSPLLGDFNPWCYGNTSEDDLIEPKLRSNNCFVQEYEVFLRLVVVKNFALKLPVTFVRLRFLKTRRCINSVCGVREVQELSWIGEKRRWDFSACLRRKTLSVPLKAEQWILCFVHDRQTPAGESTKKHDRNGGLGLPSC